jgi:hypothetical protein
MANTRLKKNKGKTHQTPASSYKLIDIYSCKKEKIDDWLVVLLLLLLYHII